MMSHVLLNSPCFCDHDNVGRRACKVSAIGMSKTSVLQSEDDALNASA